MPVALGPVGLSGHVRAARRGAGGARRRRPRTSRSRLSTRLRLRARARSPATGRRLWFQLYMIKDRGFIARCSPAPGRPAAAPWSSPSTCRPRHALPRLPLAACRAGRGRPPASAGAGAARLGCGTSASTAGRTASAISSRCSASGRGARRFHGLDRRAISMPSVTWQDVAWIRAALERPADHQGHARPRGCARGGRTAAPTGSSSPTMAAASSTASFRPPGRCPRSPTRSPATHAVLADGGVRSGLDVVRMLALGADCVLLGRAWAYALAARGEAGVAPRAQADRSRNARRHGADRVHDIGRDHAGRARAIVGRGERIRTSGPCLPKTVLYQAELLPDRNPQMRHCGRGGSQGRG